MCKKFWKKHIVWKYAVFALHFAVNVSNNMLRVRSLMSIDWEELLLIRVNVFV